MASNLLVRDLSGRTRCLVFSNPERAPLSGADALCLVSRATGLPRGDFRLVTGTREVTARGAPLPCDADGGLPSCAVLLRLCGGKARALAPHHRAPATQHPLTWRGPPPLRRAGRLWLAAARRGQGWQNHKQRRRLPGPVWPPHARRERRDEADRVAGACCPAAPLRLPCVWQDTGSGKEGANPKATNALTPLTPLRSRRRVRRSASWRSWRRRTCGR